MRAVIFRSGVIVLLRNFKLGWLNERLTCSGRFREEGITIDETDNWGPACDIREIGTKSEQVEEFIMFSKLVRNFVTSMKKENFQGT